MLKLLVLVTLFSLCAGEEAAQAAVEPQQIIQGETQPLQEVLQKSRGVYRRSHHAHRGDHAEHNDEDHGPLILRSIKHRHDSHGPDIARQNKIIEHVYSPDYAEPTWVLDYRYLKSGGRDYTRGPGGQILILPKGITTKEHKEFKNYDELIEHLRLRSIEERNKPKYIVPLGDGVENAHEHIGHHHHDDDHGHLHHRDGHDTDDWWKEH